MSENLEIFISGLYSGTNPQPGVGITRSLRQAYPDAKLVGVEYSNRCSGIHWHDFDDIWLQRPWNEIDLALHAKEIKKRLDAGAYWLSSIDLEIQWLADLFPNGRRGLLAPPPTALNAVRKPAVKAHEDLGLAIPEYVTTDLTDWELHSFCRKHNWNVWLKGPYYEAVRISNWPSLLYWKNVLSKAWAVETLFLQAHVTGYEESIMLAAYEGELLDCTYMQKRDVTELGKTWAGSTSKVPTEMILKVRTAIRKLRWTGGAEIEMVRDAADKLWLLEWNPRFPAWVHGSTITGQNLPGVLIEAATGIPQQPEIKHGDEFTRVVVELPVQKSFPLSPLPEPLSGAAGHSMKHPSGLIQFAQRLHSREMVKPSTNGHMNGHAPAPREDLPLNYVNDLRALDLTGLNTPTSVFFNATATENFQNMAALRGMVGSEPRCVQAYSIKTNPDPRLLKLARESGFLAEAISSLEAESAIAAGFATNEIILNGPAKWWRREHLPTGTYHAIFCDSIGELQDVCDEIKAETVGTEILGVRIRTPNMVSRFGIPIDSHELFASLIEAVASIPVGVRFGVHFHMASSNLGLKNWKHLFDSVLRWCCSIEALTARKIECVDIGGGSFPGDWQAMSETGYRQMIETITSTMPNVNEIISEPGKALCQSTFAVAMTVLEIRGYNGDGQEIVMDGSIAELPMHEFQPHRVLYNDRISKEWKALGRGEDKIFGRLCMEHDIVASNVKIPASLHPGDVLFFCDAGAYDRSMSYVFGCG